jgi:hypothetical protein
MSGRVKSFLRDWVIPPKFYVSFVAAKQVFSVRNPQFFYAPLGVPGRRMDPESAIPASLYDLRTAVPGDICWVPVEKIRTETAIALTAEQHPFVRYFRDGRDSLNRFYNLHRPNNSGELLFLGVWRDDVGRLATTVTGGEQFRLTPWSRGYWDLSYKQNQWFGPANHQKLSREASQLDRAKLSLEKHGLWMAYESPEPNFFELLINDLSGGPDDFRVTQGEGKHRASFLAYSGWPMIPMSPQHPSQEVRLSDVENWPGVLDGRFTKEEARAFFLAFFRDPHGILLPDW